MLVEPTGRRLEWRGDERSAQAIIAIDEDGAVVRAWKADPARLKDFLNEMGDFDTHGAAAASRAKSPRDYGPLILSRSHDGDVLSIDPQLYWENVAEWFRATGNDPHQYRKRDRRGTDA